MRLTGDLCVELEKKYLFKTVIPSRLFRGKEIGSFIFPGDECK
jgi:hypothetical protein